MSDNQNKAHILIADDEPLVRDILSRRLTGAGYQCTEALDGLDAIEKLKVANIDLMLLDISMPKKSGIEVLHNIINIYPDLAVIMVTAIGNVDMAIDAMKKGAYDYIIKPVDQKILMPSIEKALERKSLVIQNKDYQRNLEKKVAEQTNKIRESSLNAIKSLVNALEAKDKYTHGHSERTTAIAVAISEELSMPKETIEKIKLAGLLHDLGKIGVPESVLNKNGKLTEEERQQVYRHPEIGVQILTPVIDDNEIIDIIAHHHERYDGKGYPDGLRAEQITKGAQVLAVADAYDNSLSRNAMILAVADAYDAMTSDRPYRPTMSINAARAELEKERGSQFDPVIVDALFRVLDKGGMF